MTEKATETCASRPERLSSGTSGGREPRGTSGPGFIWKAALKNGDDGGGSGGDDDVKL